MTGNAAVVRGCLDAGLDCFSVINHAGDLYRKRLATELPRRGGRLLQTEDEISRLPRRSVRVMLVRAATASGPGLALMVEMLGLVLSGKCRR